MSFDEGWAEFEAEAGPILAAELSTQAPVVTGTLAGSMTWEDQVGVLTAGSRDPRGPIAAYVTRGTRPHPIDAVNAQFLHFIGRDGGDVFTKHVDHPGTAPNPFHIAAWEARRDQLLELGRVRLGHGVALQYLNPWRNRTLGS